MDASTDGLVVAHSHCCYVYVPDLLCTRLVVEAAVKTIDKLYFYV